MSMKHITLTVAGMTCTSCEVLIKDELEEHEGIQDVIVSQPHGTVTLDYNPEAITLDAIKEIIKKEGFDVQ